MSRSRGTYGPLDREKHPFMGWTQDRAIDYGRERAYDAVAEPLKPYVPEIDLAIEAHRGVRNMRDAYLLSGGRDEAQKPIAQIGGEFFHGIVDRQRAVALLSGDLRGLSNDLTTWVQAHPSAPNMPAIAQWIAADVTPTLKKWSKFSEAESKSWWTKAATAWATFADWHERIHQLRNLARAHGITLTSPEPEDLPRTIWERGEEGKGSKGEVFLGVGKTVIAAVLGVSGFIALYRVIRKLNHPSYVVHLDHGDGYDVQIPVQVQETR